MKKTYRIFIISTSFVFAFLQISFGQEISEVPLPIACEHGSGDAFTEIPFLFDAKSLKITAPQSSFIATYKDVPSEAKAAFEKAMSIWASILVSSVPIRINVKWELLGTSTLAQTGAGRVYRDFQGAFYKNTWYSVALAESIAGKELNNGEADINVSLNKSINWSYDVTGKAYGTKFDMVTVVLHEIAHGLGFNSTMTLDATKTKGTWGQSSYPYVYDILIKNGQNEFLTDTKIFGNPSDALRKELISNDLYFNLSKNTSLGFPELYAPASFKSGGSISHLDESRYPFGTANSLMSPSVRSAEVNHTPGPLILLMLNEMGWSVKNLPSSNSTALILGTENETVPEILVYPNPTSESITLSFPLSSPRNVQFYLYDLNGKQLYQESHEMISSENYEIDVNHYNSGTYILKLIDGAKAQSRKIVIF